MEQHAVALADLADLLDGLNGAHLVVGRHDGDQSRILIDGLFQLVQFYLAVLVHFQKCDPETFFFQGHGRVQHGMVFDLCGDQMLFALAVRPVQHAF